MERNTLLTKLLNISLPISVLIRELNNMNWDSDELIKLTRAHIINVLRNYQVNKFTETEVEDWANAIEGREDVEGRSLSTGC